MKTPNQDDVFNKHENNESDNKHWNTNLNTVEETDQKCHTYEEALELAGHGSYNFKLLLVISLTLMSMMADMFGFGVVVTASKCDFNLNIVELGILSSMTFTGTILMSYPWGYISDTRGRRKSLLIGMSVSFFVFIISSFSPNWKVMAVLKLIGTSFSSVAQSTTYVLLGESTVTRVRSFYLLLLTSSIVINPAIYYLLSYFILNLEFNYAISWLGISFTPWRLLTIVLALPSGISVLALLFFYESPKFLTNIGRTEEAIEILKKICVRNGGNGDNYPVKDIILEDHNFANREKEPFLRSLLNQSLPLFKPPFLARTLQLFFLVVIVYGCNSSFVLWFPYLVDVIFSSSGTNQVATQGICDFIAPSTDIVAKNITTEVIETCSTALKDGTIIAGICHSLTYSILNLFVSKFADRKKLILIMSFAISVIGGIGTSFAPDAISTIVFYIIFLNTVFAMGVLASYFVELYPTSYRGMASCLAVMVGRLSSLGGVNLVGIFIVSYCRETFYFWIALLCLAIIVAVYYLPSDKPKK